MREAHLAAQADMTLCSVVPREPWEYGRIIKDADGQVVDVVEERDCTPEQRAIRELNAGYYVFNRPQVWDVLDSLGNTNRAGEYYITDMARAYATRGGKVIAVEAPEEVAVGVNTPEQLEQIEAVLSARAAGA
jgi:bifunctional UDP-N-acetylglucosamine pyrophosphorylase/glucosamine-1-phosphate N-acetyltransferase/UDP-N-acetylglucosamine pyrophosphorylase